MCVPYRVFLHTHTHLLLSLTLSHSRSIYISFYLPVSHCKPFIQSRLLCARVCALLILASTLLHSLKHSGTTVDSHQCGRWRCVGFFFRSFVSVFSLFFYLIECFCHLFLAFSIYHLLIDISRLTHTKQNNNNI